LELTQQWIFTAASKNEPEFPPNVKGFILNITVAEYSVPFLKQYKLWLSMWLFSPIENIRKVFRSKIQKVFQKTCTVRLSEHLLSSISKVSEQSPQQYLDLLVWSLSQFDYLKLLLKKSKRVVKYLTKENRSIFLEFIYKMIPQSTSFFPNEKLFLKFISVFGPEDEIYSPVEVSIVF
jgi:hypothetical protein